MKKTFLLSIMLLGAVTLFAQKDRMFRYNPVESQKLQQARINAQKEQLQMKTQSYRDSINAQIETQRKAADDSFHAAERAAQQAESASASGSKHGPRGMAAKGIMLDGVRLNSITYSNDKNGKYFTYDEKGRVIKLVEGSVTTLYTYYSNGVMESKSETDNSTYLKKYAYDTEGTQIEYYYYFKETGDTEMKLHEKEVTTLNDDGKVLTKEKWYWNNFKKELYLSTKEEYTYDANGNMLTDSYASTSNVNEAPQITWQYSYEYDANGHLILNTYSSYDSNAKELVVQKKYEYLYDDNGNQLMEKYSEYNYTLGSLYVKYSRNRTYDKDGNMTQNVYSVYDSDSKSLRIQSEEDYTFDGKGRCVSEIYQYYNSTWKSLMKQEERTYDYDTDGYSKIETYIIYTDGSIVSYKSISYYNANGREVKYMKYSMKDSQLMLSYSSESQYDDNDRQTMCIYAEYDESGNIIADKSEKSTYTYDGSSYNRASATSYIFQGNTWVEDSKTEYKYDGIYLSEAIAYKKNGSNWDLAIHYYYTYANGDYASSIKGYDKDGNLVELNEYTYYSDRWILSGQKSSKKYGDKLVTVYEFSNYSNGDSKYYYNTSEIADDGTVMNATTRLYGYGNGCIAEATGQQTLTYTLDEEGRYNDIVVKDAEGKELKTIKVNYGLEIPYAYCTEVYEGTADLTFRTYFTPYKHYTEYYPYKFGVTSFSQYQIKVDETKAGGRNASIYNGNGKRMGRYDFEFKNGQLYVTSKDVTVYDEYGNKTEESSYSMQDNVLTLNSKTVYDYDTSIVDAYIMWDEDYEYKINQITYYTSDGTTVDYYQYFNYSDIKMNAVYYLTCINANIFNDRPSSTAEMTEGENNVYYLKRENVSLNPTRIYYAVTLNGSQHVMYGWGEKGASYYGVSGLAYYDVTESGDYDITFYFNADTKEVWAEFNFNGTAVDNVQADTQTKEQTVYSLAGQRLSNPQKGINIIGGKKVIRW